MNSNFEWMGELCFPRSYPRCIHTCMMQAIQSLIVKGYGNGHVLLGVDINIKGLEPFTLPCNGDVLLGFISEVNEDAHMRVDVQDWESNYGGMSFGLYDDDIIQDVYYIYLRAHGFTFLAPHCSDRLKIRPLDNYLSYSITWEPPLKNKSETLKLRVVYALFDNPVVRKHIRMNQHFWYSWSLVVTQSVKNCAATVIQRAWRNAISNPKFDMCRKRLNREFEDMHGMGSP